jgi:hypothetical protein
MADQIVLSWTVDVSGTLLGPAEAATALGAVPLYDNDTTDPVLGQFFGLTVASDTSFVSGPSEATRVLKLNTNIDNDPPAPPPFPCQPITAVPPKLPYPLTRAKPLGGSFFVQTGVAVVAASRNQTQTLNPTDVIEFLSQQGVQYTILSLTEDEITLTAAFTGKTTNTPAFQRVPAPATKPAVFSTSDLDSVDIPETVPPIPEGPGGAEVEIEYFDSTGAGPFDAEVELTGRRPVALELEAGSIDIAVITAMQVEDYGTFENSVGQITLVDMAEDIPELPFEPTPDEYRGRLTDEAQLLIDRHLVYLPPSYFAFSQQQRSITTLEGDFFVTTGSKRVKTSEDQSAVLAEGDVIQFASQRILASPLGTRQVFYVVEDVAEKNITLTEPYTGVDDTFTGQESLGVTSNMETKGQVGAAVFEKRTDAFFIQNAAGETQAEEPTEDELAVHLAEHKETFTAGPPPAPPLDPVTVPTPTFLSDIFTKTLQLALAGVPVAPQEITFIP